MDVSKLPRLSGEKERAPTPSAEVEGVQEIPPAAERAPAIVPPRVARPVAPSISATGAEVWFSVIIGIVFLALGRAFGSYLWAMISRQPFHTGWTYEDGTEMGYWDLQGGTAFSDSAIFLFGLALIVDAVCLGLSNRSSGSRRGLVLGSLLVMLAAVIYNAFVCLKLFNMGITPLISLLAVAFGGYAVFYQWGIVRSGQDVSRHRG